MAFSGFLEKTVRRTNRVHFRVRVFSNPLISILKFKFQNSRGTNEHFFFKSEEDDNPPRENFEI